MPVTLRELPAKFFRDSLTFHPAETVMSLMGGAKPTYSGAGATMAGVVQPRVVRRQEPNGVVTSLVVHDIFVRMSDYLDSGLDLAVDDQCVWTTRGKTLGLVGGMRDRGGRGLIAWFEAVEIVF